MGWSGGSYVANKFIDELKKLPGIDRETRVKIYKAFIRGMHNNDWDTENESVGRDDAFDEALGWKSEDDEDEA